MSSTKSNFDIKLEPQPQYNEQYIMTSKVVTDSDVMTLIQL